MKIMQEVRVSTLNVKEGMQLSREVISDNDIFLIPADTILTKNHMLKLELYQIGYVYIYEIVDSQTDYISSHSERITRTKDFKEFHEEYNNQLTSLKNSFSKITETGDVDMDELDNLAHNISSEINKHTNIFSYLCRLQAKDDTLYTHSMNVSIYGNIFAKWLRLNETDVMNLTIAGMLHDIGKTMIDDAILNKEGKLTDDEFKIIKNHTILGYKMISQSTLDYGIKQAVLMHHERINGYGYPLGIHWDNVHNYSKIIGIVDIYDAMTADRPYHKAYHPFFVIRMFEEECYGVLDTGYLYTFLQHIANNYLGERVLLSTGEEGQIVFINSQSPSRPLIKTKDMIYNLLERNDITIREFI
jgi:putative nucleotidyltransferase with HDIG domain